MPKIAVENLTKVFGGENKKICAVDEVCFSIETGAMLGLVGESGSGKSTLARLILNLLPPTSGKILLDGVDTLTLSRLTMRRRMQIVFQDPYSSLSPRQKIFDAIFEPLVIHKFFAGNKMRQGQRVHELLELVKLPVEFACRFPFELSGGERQRVMIARALSLQPEFLIYDEPVSSLDVSIRAEILQLLKDIHKQFNITGLFISHDLAVVYGLCDTVAVMHNGKIVEINDPKKIFNSPQDPYTSRLIQSVPRRLYKMLDAEADEVLK